MKRFLLALALVGVAGATYVATAPGSQTAGPTAAQFRALKSEVNHLKTKVTNLKAVVVLDTILLSDCMASSAPIVRRGDWQTPTGPTWGYTFSNPAINSGTPFPETALDIANNGDSNPMWITGGGAQCGADVGTVGRKLAHLAGLRSRYAPQPFGAAKP